MTDQFNIPSYVGAAARQLHCVGDRLCLDPNDKAAIDKRVDILYDALVKAYMRLNDMQDICDKYSTTLTSLTLDMDDNNRKLQEILDRLPPR
jgi:hypothetical protein